MGNPHKSNSIFSNLHNFAKRNEAKIWFWLRLLQFISIVVLLLILIFRKCP